MDNEIRDIIVGELDIEKIFEPIDMGRIICIGNSIWTNFYYIDF